MDRKIIDYFIICERYNSDFDGVVKEAITRGWHPVGGLCASKDDFLRQAMVKYEEEQTDDISALGKISGVEYYEPAFCGDMEILTDGQWVSREDYEALKKRNIDLEEELEDLGHHIQDLNDRDD